MKPARALTREERKRITVRQLSNQEPGSSIANDVRTGLSADPKFLPPRYFYDERGSWLFEKICETPEYYLTRTEDTLLAEISDSVIEQARPQSILELGSGSSRKTIQLLQSCDRQGCYARYLPFDVCAEMLFHAGERLLLEYPWLNIEALVGDYCADLERIPGTAGPRLILFLGSTIGNFDEDEAVRFLCGLRSIMNEDDHLLFGVDRVKNADVLNAAYNDAAGLTAEFNRNVLRVINRELAGEFDVDTFEHRAQYNQARSRIEIHLHATIRQTVVIHELDMEVEFAKDESILTEISRKFTPASLDAMLANSGFVAVQHFAPQNAYFSVVLTRPAA